MAKAAAAPTQIQTVLAKGPIPDPIPTLEEARSDAGRRKQIQEVRKQINELGIKYIFFQQVSVSGHVNGKGVVGDHVGEGGRGRLPARLRRHRRPVRRPLRPLHRLRARGVRARRDRRRGHLRAASVGFARRARVLRLLRHGDRRAARGRPAPEPQADRERGREGARLHVPLRRRARDDVDEAPARLDRSRTRPRASRSRGATTSTSSRSCGRSSSTSSTTASSSASTPPTATTRTRPASSS